MTKNYVSSAQKLFDGIKQDVTSSSVRSLTIVTSMSTGAAIIDLFTESKPTFTSFGFMSVKILNYVSNMKKYDVRDIEYDKDIK